MLDYLKNNYVRHIDSLCGIATRGLEKYEYDGLIVSSGVPFTYFSDDSHPPFRPTPHFSHWCPEPGPHHLMIFEPGQKPHLLLYQPKDFWEDWTLAHDFWQDQFRISYADDLAKRSEFVAANKKYAYIGPEEDAVPTATWDKNPPKLSAYLDWNRAVKTDYEQQCLTLANEAGAKAHKRARMMFAQGASELEMHYGYIDTLGCVDWELPYESIIAGDSKSAILHYRLKRKQKDHQLVLIDSGAKYLNYCSDITRTYIKSSVHPVFRALLQDVEHMQQRLCGLVTPGLSVTDLQKETVKQTAEILLNNAVIKNISVEEAVEKNLVRTFYPHGVSHLLGIQVHDVGGRQINEDGDLPQPQENEAPGLRTRRALRENEVLTVEPGLYFIPSLLTQLQKDKPELAACLNTKLIEELLPHGGIRIEDNIVVKTTGPLNLTRLYLGNDFLTF